MCESCEVMCTGGVCVGVRVVWSCIQVSSVLMCQSCEVMTTGGNVLMCESCEVMYTC